MQIIPAIDLINGCAVRLRQGDFAQKTTYSTDPVGLAQQFEDAGLQRLHIVDLDGAKAGQPRQLAILEKIATKTRLQIDFGGGLRTQAHLQNVLDAGAAWVAVGSVAVLQPDLFAEWLQIFKPQRFLVGADVRDEKIAVKGWQEQTDVGLFDFLTTLYQSDVRQIFVTDIARDGLLQGAATELYQRIVAHFPDIQLIASGGVSSAADFQVLRQAGCTGVIVGKAYFEGRITLEELGMGHG